MKPLELTTPTGTATVSAYMDNHGNVTTKTVSFSLISDVSVTDVTVSKLSPSGSHTYESRCSRMRGEHIELKDFDGEYNYNFIMINGENSSSVKLIQKFESADGTVVGWFERKHVSDSLYTHAVLIMTRHDGSKHIYNADLTCARVNATNLDKVLDEIVTGSYSRRKIYGHNIYMYK